MSISDIAARLSIALAASILLLISRSGIAQLTDDELEALDSRATAPFFGEPLKDPEARSVYILAVYNKTNFFIDQNGRYRGFEHDILKGFEKYINKGIKKASHRHILVFIPMRFEDILPALAQGKGDLAAANLTVTEERSEIVDFADPYLPRVNEIVVTRKNGSPVDSINDLAGRKLLVIAGSSYMEHLELLNDRFAGEGREVMEIVEAKPEFDHADLLDLVNSGAAEITIADEHIANAWAPMFPNIVLKHDVVIHGGGNIAWAVRKNIPEFKEKVNAYVKQIRKGTLIGNIAFNDYYRNRHWLKNPLEPNELAKLDKVVGYMKKYGERYSWDWIAVAAQSYQESQLDHRKVSPAGAVGIMQLLPSTAAQKPISIKNIKNVEDNIHAGVKYLSFIRRHYFSDPEIAPADRVDFSWAAYNAGPSRIQKLRKRAAKRGYDPNKWFNHVEHMASESIGRETVDYVVNINKYYVAYKFALERQERILQAREARKEAAELATHRDALEAWRRSYARHRN